MVTLKPMSQEDFEKYFPVALDRLSTELGKARRTTPKESKEMAEQSFNTLFPDRKVKSKDQFVFTILSEDVTVGILHFGIRRDRQEPYAFVWDLEICRTFRSKGFGSQAMARLEQEVLSLGISLVGLNVFAHNDHAIELYKKLKYKPTSITMFKTLSEVQNDNS